MASYALTTVTRNVPAIHCLLCDAVSPLLDDIAHRYCGRCHLFLEVVDQARQMHADGATHDCGEWRTARDVCAVCGEELLDDGVPALCRASSPPTPWSWFCTRPRSHDGDHIAAIGPYVEGEAVLAQWSRARFITIYHWDTFDNTTMQVGAEETLAAAEHFVQEHYGTRLADDGADRIDIVDAEGTVVKQYRVR